MADETKLALTVATPLGMQLDLEVESVQLPGVAGEFGVLPGHVPLLAALRSGVLRYRQQGQIAIAAIGSGFAEADATHVRVISEFFSKPSDVSIEEARADLSKAEQSLKAHAVLDEPEHIEAQGELDWARARIEVAGGVH
ncbi:MAG TPA: ATP synthase F1 subunit epsilon [Polyangiales bacterium]|nr:ATP synthase F1 subunit epsilon [Polyangiales bacterium]